MKTVIRMIRRYVLATAAVVLTAAALLAGVTAYLGLRYGELTDDRLPFDTVAAAVTPTEDGTLHLDAQKAPQDPLKGYAWAMVLDDDGNILWQQNLPDKLNHRYTAKEIASFAHWYLDDYPVLCRVADYGLFVAALPRGTLWKYNISMNLGMMEAIAAGIVPAEALLAAVVSGCCLLFGWRGARQLQAIAAGLEAVADGQTVRLPTDGFAGELADTVNRAGEQLRRRNEIIARRDDARTNWIAGVSHDVRTPLAVILGRAEQLEQDTALPESARRRAAEIRTQSEKLRTLIEDLNLTSKLQYGAQPLRRAPVQTGPLLRRIAADFCESPQAADCAVELNLTPEADRTVLQADAALLTRAAENLLNNAVCHNPGPVQIEISAERTENAIKLTLEDDGTGCPPAVLEALRTGITGENTPHILGLHVVEQIIQAHGGRAAFLNGRRGMKAVLTIPIP